MVKTDIKTDMLWKNYWIVVSVLFIISFTASSLYYINFKKKMANQLSSTVIRQLEVGDTRSAILILSDTSRSVFSSIRFYQQGQLKFQVPQSAADQSLMEYSITISIPVIKGGLVMSFLWAEVVGLYFIIFILAFLLSYFSFKKFVLQVDKVKILEMKVIETKMYNQIATQVAHDIRSPLAALSGVVYNLKLDQSDANGKVLTSVIDRINRIAEDLLSTNRDASIENDLKTKPEQIELLALIVSVISEKKLQYAQYEKLEIGLNTMHKKCVVLVDPSHFARLLSNLINNAAEAMNFNGNIAISVTQKESELSISITDQGPGIPTEILAKIGEHGNTNKDKGNGLGLFHAKKMIEAWSGRFDIETSTSGTTIILSLPICNTKSSHPTVVLLDDDELVCMSWEMRARKKNIPIKTYSHPEKFFAELSDYDSSTHFYIDSCLGADIQGEDIAQQLNQQGYKHIFLATGYEADRFAHLDFLSGVVGKEFPL